MRLVSRLLSLLGFHIKVTSFHTLNCTSFLFSLKLGIEMSYSLRAEVQPQNHDPSADLTFSKTYVVTFVSVFLLLLR